MNSYALRSRLYFILSNYIDFLPLCETSAQKFKLLDEIIAMREKIKQIDRMSECRAVEQIQVTEYTIESVAA
jgi:hypothetical protein